MRLIRKSIVIASFFATALQPAFAGEAKIKIGVLADMSGPAGDIGKGSVIGARLAAEEFGNKVLGRDIEIVTGDTLNKPDVAAGLVRKWFDVDGVDVIVDMGSTNIALAVMPIAAQKNKIAIAVSPAGTNITNEGCTATSIHWIYDTYALSAGTAKVLVDKGLKSWFFVTVDYAFGHALEKDASEYVQTHGGKTLGSVRHPLASSDMSSYVLTAQGSKAQVVALANSNADTVNAVKDARQFGLTNNQYIAPLVMYLSTVHGMGLDVAQGLYLTEGFYWNQDEKARAFAEKYKAKAGEMPGSLPAGTYSAVLNYLKAIEAVKSDDTQAILKHLRSIKIDDPVIRDGRIREDGRLVHDMYVFQVKSPAESKEPFDYYKTVGIVKGDDAFQPISKSRCPLIKK